MEASFSFEKLQVYQKAVNFIDSVYLETRSFPKTELYGLTSQYRRAANSIALNIAEGSGSTDSDFNRYLRIALNSACEFVVCSTIALQQKYIDKDQNNDARLKLEELSKMISSLQKYLKNK